MWHLGHSAHLTAAPSTVQRIVHAIHTTGNIRFMALAEVRNLFAGHVDRSAAGAYHVYRDTTIQFRDGLRYNAFRNGYREQTSRATDAGITRKSRFDHARRA